MSQGPFYREPSYEREARLREKRDDKVMQLKALVKKLNVVWEHAKDQELLDETLPENGNTIGELLATVIDETNDYIKTLERG